MADLTDREVRCHKYFLDPHISLDSLSRKIGTNRTYLTQAILWGSGCSFCTYVNQLRIDEVVQKGEQVLQSEDLLFNTALACGYNNRRTFKRAFFREMGISPADFVAQHKLLSLQQDNQQNSA